MAEGSSIKAKMSCVIMLFVFSVVCLLGGIWQTGIYNDLTNNCTAEVTGIVDEESYNSLNISSDPVETEYLIGDRLIKGKMRIKRILYSNKVWMIHIDVQTDDLFKTENIYANLGTEKVGDTVIIHYSPDDPTHYYIGDRVNEYKSSGVFSYAMGGVMFVLSLLSLIFIRHLAKKATEV